MTVPNSGPDPAAAPGDPSLWRVHVVVDLHEVAADDADRAREVGAAADAVAAALPWPDLPAMTDSASRDAAVVAADDSRSLEVVLLLEARTEEEAGSRAVDVVRRTLDAAGVPARAATPSQVLVRDAYLP